jgi:BirA family transcriptional regulator, biotin operon repressor / biotin---[acetyl-CoA-carboxylase] ligase
VIAFGTPHHHLRTTGSTNDVARKLAEEGAPSGTIVTASEQSSGRGRRGRVWAAPAGKALLFSAILRPLELAHTLLPLSVPVAVCEAVESLAPVHAQIKWPNDVWINEAKVAGVLIEARPPDWAVIGIGLNVAIAASEFPADLRWPATSVGHEANVDAARDAVCATLARWVEAPQTEALDAFRKRDALAGREIGWTGAGAEPGEGVAAGVDERGNLVVDLPGGGRVELGSGEVSLRLR